MSKCARFFRSTHVESHGEKETSMKDKKKFRSLIFGTSSYAAAAALTIAIVFALMFALTQSAQTQSFQVIHEFTGGADGAFPNGGLTIDAAGNLYGTAWGGGESCCGTVFEMSPGSSGWTLTTIHSFSGPPDGATPAAEVVFGPDGRLYGTTYAGGVAGGCGYGFNGSGCGTVFSLQPTGTSPRPGLEPWTETVLYSFGVLNDGTNPYGPVVFDQAGNIYGSANLGTSGASICQFRPSQCGTVYKLTPSSDGWKESTIYSFNAWNYGWSPYGAVILDHAGNLYGTTYEGGAPGVGTVYELMPSASGWTQKVIYSFPWDLSNGAIPIAGLLLDQHGNLFGATVEGGPSWGGTVFELTPSGGDWVFTLVYSFTGVYEDGLGPADSLTMDGAGNLYGTTYGDGIYPCNYSGCGNVFKLTRSENGWTYTSLYDFTGGADGANPYSNVIFDAHGNLYGTTSYGGAYGGGVVWEITP
jgi:uncharacterized repeat protein (TIGR03803 family)